MKIHDIPGIRQPQKTRGSSGSAKAKGDFQEVMNQVINRDTLNQPTEASGNHMLAPASVLHVQSAQPFGQGRETDASGKKALREVESALEMAGHYADKLADPDVKTEALEPLVSHLEERLHGLNQLGGEGTLDRGLKEIISDLNINLVTEIAKFRRGDYS
ncbi:MAG: hypothetical protein WAL98_14715 [Desulfatiglandaceae bacterium]